MIRLERESVPHLNSFPHPRKITVLLLPPRFVILLLFAVVVPALSQSKRSFWVKWQFNYLPAEFDYLIIGKQDRVKAMRGVVKAYLSSAVPTQIPHLLFSLSSLPFLSCAFTTSGSSLTHYIDSFSF
jgi:hypothetical protein